MFLALAELRRSIGRFTLLGGAVGLLVLLLLFFQTVAGALTGGLTGAFEAAEAQVWVYDADARLNPQASVIDGVTAEDVAAIEGVATADPVTFTVFDVADEPAAIVGVEPGSAALPSELDDGGELDGAGDVVIGASSFVPAPDGQLSLGGTELEVVGRADGATFNILPTLFTSREVVAGAVADRAGQDVPLPTSAIAVRAVDGVAPTELATRITSELDGVEAVGRATAIANLPGAGTITRSFSILYVLLYLVVAIVTAVFFLILTTQKRDAMVLLRAVGGRPRDLVVPVLIQVVVVVGVAIAVGSATAAGLLAVARDVFGTGLELSTVATSSVAILILGLIAGLLSVRRVLNVEPIEAVRGGGL